MRSLLLALGYGLLSAFPHAGQASQRADPDFAWVQMVAGGAEVRAVVRAGAQCPVARVDGKRRRLARRAAPASPIAGYPDTCQMRLPANAAKLTLAGKSLPVPTNEVIRIIVVGDTGCRVTRNEAQNCAKDWPFGVIARLAAAKRPDLIVHVGDYYYREQCPEGQRRCENWPNWKADFFDPARPLFTAAPWVFARGNHESCGRAAHAWVRYLDAAERPLSCPGAVVKPFLVPLGGVTIAVVDSADIVDSLTGDKKLEAFAAALKSVQPATRTPQWIVTHKPPFVQGYIASRFTGDVAVSDPEMPDVDLILAGHLHLFGSMEFDGARPAQLIVGNSGTRLMVKASAIDKQLTASNPNAMHEGKGKVDGKEAEFTIKARFGYFLLERADSSSEIWTGTLYSATDTPMVTCRVFRRNLDCDQAD